jgi:integrase
VSRKRAANHADRDSWQLSRQVRIWEIRIKEGKPDAKNPTRKVKKTYVVRWVVESNEHQRTYATRALADAERSKLVGYQQQGCAFDVASGVPEPLLRARDARSWYQHMCLFIDMKWPTLEATSRKSVGEALASITPALLSTGQGAPDAALLRRLVYKWVAVAPARRAGPPPADLLAAAKWLEANTVPVAALADRRGGAELTRGALNALALTVKGNAAAANTVNRRRAVFYNVLQYAVEQGQLDANPIDFLAWAAPKSVQTVDRRSVANMDQGRSLLAAVGSQGAMGKRLVVFFALMMYAALRPSEAIRVRRPNLASMPSGGGWGELLLSGSTPRSGTAWTDSGQSREDKSLKHRAAGDTRSCPAHPELVAIINQHIEAYGFGPNGRLVAGPQGGIVDEATYLTVWRRAREAALTPEEAASPLAYRPYDLRHMAVSTWLNAGVDPTQVAEWAGHSVAVLWRVYAKCVVGKDRIALDKIEQATKPSD